ncbi:MAG: hypothetical protein KJO43_15605 [Phycisphaerae bacterium]|nr:hypothetical protein [Phycisphaerae bacterium]
MNDRHDSDSKPGEILSIIATDRLCRRCGYNLVGQGVSREPHYGLLVARCPECGQVADVLEYPTLGRWAARCTTLLIAFWFIALVGMLFPTGAATIAFPLAIAEGSARSYERFLEVEHTQFEQRVTAGEITAADTQFRTWWTTHHDRRMPWQHAIDWQIGVVLFPASLVLFALGWFWSIALLGLRRRWLLLFGLIVLAFAAVIVGVECVDWLDDPPTRAWRAARSAIAPPVAGIVLAYLSLPLAAGLLFGRPLTRTLVRGLLPVRLSGALAFLWLADGRRPPAGRAGAVATPDRD